MRKIYLAGPMRGRAEFNAPAFRAAEARCREYGFEVVNPLDLDVASGHDVRAEGPQSIADYMAQDVPAALACDAIVVLPGWTGSQGVRIETAVFAACKGEGHVVDLDFDVVFTDYLRPGVEPLDDQGERELDLVDDDLAFHDEIVERGFEIPRATPACCGDPGDCYVHSFTTAKTDEVRSTSPTGGEKGVKPEDFASMPWDALAELAVHYGIGAKKYAAYNYRRGYPWSQSFSALMRHAGAFWQGEDLDPETGTKHVLAVAFHALTLAVFMNEHGEYDDRPSSVL